MAPSTPARHDDRDYTHRRYGRFDTAKADAQHSISTFAAGAASMPYSSHPPHIHLEPSNSALARRQARFSVIGARHRTIRGISIQCYYHYQHQTVFRTSNRRISVRAATSSQTKKERTRSGCWRPRITLLLSIYVQVRRAAILPRHAKVDRDPSCFVAK